MLDGWAGLVQNYKIVYPCLPLSPPSRRPISSPLPGSTVICMVHEPQQWVLKSIFDQETCIFFKGVSIHPYTPWDRNICPHSPPECRRSQTGMFGPTCRRRSARHARSKLNDPNVRRTTRRSLYPGHPQTIDYIVPRLPRPLKKWLTWCL